MAKEQRQREHGPLNLAREAPDQHLRPGPGKRPAACFQCDGSGEMCDVCGASRAFCESSGVCGDDATYADCDNCNGSGRVYVTS
jgi:hypothetical protein